MSTVSICDRNVHKKDKVVHNYTLSTTAPGLCVTSLSEECTLIVYRSLASVQKGRHQCVVTDNAVRIQGLSTVTVPPYLTILD